MKEELPVIVFVPSASAQKCSYHGWLNRPTPDDYRHEAIGVLADFVGDVADTNAVDRLNAELTPHGIEVSVIVRSVVDVAGYYGCSLCLGVFFESLQDAKKIPSFKQWFVYSGGYYVPPELTDLPVADDGEVRRVFIGAYPPPKHDQDGAFVFSCLPAMQIAALVFLKDDPQHLYQFTGKSAMLPREEKIARARKMME